VELIEPRRQQRLDRRRYRHVALRSVAQKRDHLLNEERVALSGLANLLSQRSGYGSIRGDMLDQRVRLVVGQALERDRRCVRTTAAPAGIPLQQLPACDATEHERRLARERRPLLDQHEEGGLAPL